MTFYGYHGVLPEEKKIGQRFLVDVILETDLYEAGKNDRLGETINYAEVYQITREIVEGPGRNLIESVAENIAESLLRLFHRAVVCRVKVTKTDPPIAGYYDSVAVEITRKRATAYIGLGSNLGDREHYLQQALELLDQVENVAVVRCSSIYETAPYGPVEQGDFLNMAASIETLLPPMQLLKELHRIENALGRKRDIHWGPRSIDLDILLFNRDNIEEEKLSVPHPELPKRLFVLAPLMDIASHLIVPGINRSVTELYQRFKNEKGVQLWKRNNGEGEFGLFEN